MNAGIAFRATPDVLPAFGPVSTMYLASSGSTAAASWTKSREKSSEYAAASSRSLRGSAAFASLRLSRRRTVDGSSTRAKPSATATSSAAATRTRPFTRLNLEPVEAVVVVAVEAREVELQLVPRGVHDEVAGVVAPGNREVGGLEEPPGVLAALVRTVRRRVGDVPR